MAALRDNVATERMVSPIATRLFLAALFAGFGEYSAVAALADVAKAFGHPSAVQTVSSVIGLSGSVLGIGLAVLRLSSLAALPLTAMADRRGRRSTLQWSLVVGLALTCIAAASPSYWIFVACFAVGRPFLSAALSLLQVVSVELSSAQHRIGRLALVAAGSGGGAGLAAVLHGAIRGGDGFRWLFALALLPLVLVVPILRGVPESQQERTTVRLGAVARSARPRLLIVGALVATLAVISGPANGFLFVYGESLLGISPGRLALIVTASALTGLLGLWLSHHIANWRGRRFTVSLGIVGSAAAATFAYSGGVSHFIIGYFTGVCMGGLITPSLNALSVELFAPSARATVGGWVVVATVLGATIGLVSFGLLTGTGHVVASQALRRAAYWVFLPMVPVGAVVWLLPETHQRELSETSSMSV